jgi:polyribonucleotide 5'-hydroxyl-kinase
MTTMNNAAATAGSIPIEYRLAEDNELRFEVTSDEGDAVLELIDGDAEVFGTELVLHQKYVFPPGSRVAVFTWHSAVVELCGKTESPPYVAKHTPMVIEIMKFVQK